MVGGGPWRAERSFVPSRREARYRVLRRKVMAKIVGTSLRYFER
jgi:hypothetical protein